MKQKIISAIALFIVLTGLVSSAGIVSPYWKDHPLYMNYGETKTVNFNLQNMVGNEDIVVELSLKQGSNIATLEETIYVAEAGTHDTMIPLKIKIPEDYNGGVQRIELEAKTIVDGTEGMVVLGTGWLVSFNVIVEEKPVSGSSLLEVILGLIVLLIVLAIVLIILVRKKR